MFKLYDTYKKKLVPFKPLKKGKVGMYHCGPTVYNYITIGNIRAYVFNDILRRTIEYLGYEVTQVMNITDVGHLTLTDEQKEKLKNEKLEITDTEDGLDRMEKAARREGLTVLQVAQKYIDAIFGKNYKDTENFEDDGDLGKMNILKPTHLPRATEFIDEQIEFIKQLEKKGYTYITDQAVYFDIQKFPKYEKLVGQKFSDMVKGNRSHSADPERKHPADFRLWQLNQPDHALQWESPWGRGYPGWHIECSAMGRELLGQPYDIHTGGEDFIKLHHANEIAQSECAYGKPEANYWLHNAFLTVDGGRMGKSLGNAYTLEDVMKKGFDPMDLRYFYLQAHYRSKQDFTWECLEDAKNSRAHLISELREKMKESNGKREISKNWKEKFVSGLEKDINTCEALTTTWELLRSDEKAEVIVGTILDFDKVLGLRLDEITFEERELADEDKKKLESLIDERHVARETKNWKKSDEIRDRLADEYGVELEDTEKGTNWVIRTK